MSYLRSYRFWAVETVNTWDLRLYAISGTSVDLISGDFYKPRKADTVGARLYGTCPCPTTWYIQEFLEQEGHVEEDFKLGTIIDKV